jgi:tetratricopeptide (TPR) repeat protein
MTPCPSVEQLERLLAAQLEGATAEAVEQHVQACAACQQTLERLTAARLARTEQGQPRTSFLRQLENVLQGAAVTQRGPDGSAAEETVDLPAVAGYAVERELGRGAFGVIYLARQQRTNRPVAVKMLLQAACTQPELVARFLFEGEIIAGLKHPNIVQLHEIGTHAGRPFLVLEYVEGGSLRDQVQGQPLPPRQAAALLETLARAVHAAHLRGVVHRDLKPANILRDRDGTPKVTDFGIAKHLEGDGGWTQTGLLVGTPSYMAPEQATQAAGRLGPAADVWALGVILYELLTGRLPFTGDTQTAVLLQVREAEPRPPRSWQPQAPRDLEVVCLRCLRKDPAQRFASAEALAEELRRFLAGEPIRSRPVGPVERAFLWARRHPAVALLSACLAGVTVLAFGLVTWQWRVALDQKQQAEHHRREAEANLAMARQAVDDYCLKVSADQRLLGNRPLRQELLRTAVPFYEQFLQRRSDDPAVRAELGRASLRLAEVTEQIGDVQQALTRAEQAVDFFAALARDYPGEPDYQRELATSHRGCGTLYGVVGRTADAETAYRQALAIFQQVAESRSSDPAAEDEVATTYQNLAWLRARTGKAAGAEEAFGEALRLRRSLVRRDPENAEYQRRKIAGNLTTLGLLYRDLGRAGDAVKVYQEAAAILRRLVKGHPDESADQDALARCLNNLGITYFDLNRMAEAERDYREALAIQRRVVERQPEVLAYQSMLGKVLDNLGNACKRLNKLQDAGQAYREAEAVFRRLADQNPLVLEYAVDLAGNLGNQGDLLLRAERWREALSRHDAVIARLQDVLKKEPGHTVARDFLTNTYKSRAEALGGLRRYAEALRACEQALSFDDGRRRTVILLTRADLLARSGDHRRAAAEADDLARDRSLGTSDRYNLACVLSLAAAAASADGKLSMAERNRLAERYGARAVELLRQLHATGMFKNSADLALLKKDTDLDAIRSRADFRKLLAEPGGKEPAAR